MLLFHQRAESGMVRLADESLRFGPLFNELGDGLRVMRHAPPTPASEPR